MKNAFWFPFEWQCTYVSLFISNQMLFSSTEFQISKQLVGSLARSVNSPSLSTSIILHFTSIWIKSILTHSDFFLPLHYCPLTSQNQISIYFLQKMSDHFFFFSFLFAVIFALQTLTAILVSNYPKKKKKVILPLPISIFISMWCWC